MMTVFDTKELGYFAARKIELDTDRWEILRPGDIKQKGDEFFAASCETWKPFSYLGEEIDQYTCVGRRPVSQPRRLRPEDYGYLPRALIELDTSIYEMVRVDEVCKASHDFLVPTCDEWLSVATHSQASIGLTICPSWSPIRRRRGILLNDPTQEL